MFYLDYKCSPSDKSGSQKNVYGISQKVYLLKMIPFQELLKLLLLELSVGKFLVWIQKHKTAHKFIIIHLKININQYKQNRQQLQVYDQLS